MWIRPAAVVLCALGLLSMAGFATAKARSSRAAISVNVNLGSSQQVIQGFGTSQRIWADPHLSKSTNTQVPASVQAQILTALYGRLGLTRARDSLNSGIENSKGAPFNFSATLTDGQAQYVKQAMRYGLRTYFPAPVYLEDWMQPGDPAGYVDYAMAILQRFKQLGAEPPFYSVVNEPVITHDFPPQWMHDVVIALGSRLKAAGFKTKLVIPDDENPTDAYRRAIAVLQDPQARQYVGALAYHIYKWDRGDMVKMRQLATQYKLPVWMTEYESPGYTDWSSSLDWAQRMHVLLTEGGVNAIDYLWGFFGSWVRTDTMISIDFQDGVFQSWSPTPIYWITGQYSRFVRPGYVRVSTSSSSGPVLASAYKGPKRAVVVVTNTSGSTQSIRVAVVGGKLAGAIQPVQSSATEHWKSLSPMHARGGSFTATLPPQSITTFVAPR
jgi:O-glycosyl hydrolase